MARLIAWLGGGVFVASLALCTWWFIVPLGVETPFRGWQPLVANALLLTVFAAHHSLFARPWVQRRLTVIDPLLQRSSYVWLASLLFIAVILLWIPVGGVAYRLEGPLAWIAIGVQLAGVWMIVESVRGLDALELAGIRQVITVASSSDRRPLQVGGPYGWVRHPLYLGWMLALFASPRMTGDRLAFAALTSFYLVIAVPWEEASLRQSFGESYRRYERNVRWRIVPYLY
ncbi:MAG TPA: hypothetical protein VH583_19580 [Vicinamibacterales bacterium]